MKIYYIFIFVVAMLFAFASCGKKEAKQEVQQEDEIEMYLSTEDTVAVVSMTNSYMSHVQKKEYADAVAMLYVLDRDSLGVYPRELDNDEIAAQMATLKEIPIKEYIMKSIEFKEAENNEVLYGVNLEMGVTVNWSLKPVRYLGKWYLCLRDSFNGDKHI